MSIKELLKAKKKRLQLTESHLKNGLINIIFNKNGVGNYDIFEG
jgi:hypothetical protein